MLIIHIRILKLWKTYVKCLLGTLVRMLTETVTKSINYLLY